jgi:hypothetical protein
MLTAVDSSVLVDVFIADEKHGAASRQSLHQAIKEGGLIVCECVLAEVTPALPRDQVKTWMEDWGISCLPSTEEVALLAGEMFRKYLERGGKRGRVVADFLIGAHATVHADRLLARDHGFYRDYFKSLKVWDPSEKGK